LKRLYVYNHGLARPKSSGNEGSALKPDDVMTLDNCFGVDAEKNCGLSLNQSRKMRLLLQKLI